MLFLRASLHTSTRRGFQARTPASCRSSHYDTISVPSRLFSSARNLHSYDSVNPQKPYYVTTPIFYVNAAPHVGHLYTMVLADILKRYQVMCNRPARLHTGTDEHGMKVQQAATKANSEPLAFCDRGAAQFQDLAEKAGLSHDLFVRTSDTKHREAVQYAWTVLQQQGYIYLSKHEGWYSVSDETFYPENAVQLIVEPATGRKIMSSVETGKEVEWTSETNYKFRLSAFAGALRDHYRAHPDAILPQQRHAMVLAALEDGLEDLSVSRPSSRLTWGVPVPNDASQTIYVWLDALLNYVSFAGYPWPPSADNTAGNRAPPGSAWPADVQVIGKDIVRFHCIYWPAFLLALDLPLPRRILTHAHWTLGRTKMSKSLGNVVNPFFAIDRFGLDPLRYYLARDGGLLNDADYSNEHVVTRYKSDLQNDLGNLVTRVLRGKKWSVERAVQRVRAGELPHLKSAAALVAQAKSLDGLSDRVDAHMQRCNSGQALKEIMAMVTRTNVFLHTAKPWTIEKEEEIYLDAVIYTALESIRIVAIHLTPCMPGKAGLILDHLGVDGDKRYVQFAKVGADDTYGLNRLDMGKGAGSSVFPPLLVED